MARIRHPNRRRWKTSLPLPAFFFFFFFYLAPSLVGVLAGLGGTRHVLVRDVLAKPVGGSQLQMFEGNSEGELESQDKNRLARIRKVPNNFPINFTWLYQSALRRLPINS